MNDKLQELRAKQAQLQERLENIKRDYRTGLDADSGERAVQLENAEVLNEITRTTAQELENIEREIEKLAGHEQS